MGWSEGGISDQAPGEETKAMTVKSNFHFRIAKITIVATIMLLVSCSVQEEQNMPDKEFLFSQFVGENVSLNKEIYLVSDQASWDITNQSALDLTIQNKSENEINLTNLLAELRVFRYDERSETWEEAYVYLGSFPDEIILQRAQSGSASFDLIGIKPDDLEIQKSDGWLRFYISGTEIESSKEIGAYLDIPLIQE
jgi:hypothetical protein